MTDQLDALDRLTAEARADLQALSHPDRPWLTPTTTEQGEPVLDVIVIGGGQSGVIITAMLRREGLNSVELLDGRAPGAAGPWATYARMAELRTPKQLVGAEMGIPSLSVQRWFEATHGPEAWKAIERIPRLDWKAYLDWYQQVLGVSTTWETTVTDVRNDHWGSVTVESRGPGGRVELRHARAVVLATGFEGAGGWTVPDFVSQALPPDRYHHTNGPIDFDALAGAKVGVLGHGASAFDNAIAAVSAGAESVDICFRRARLPRVNPHRFLETAGVMTHFHSLSDDTRWRIARHFRVHDQPPPVRSFETALGLPSIRLRPATPWDSVELDGDTIRVATPQGELHFDQLLLATGASVDLSRRPELSTLAPLVARWSDRFQPPQGLEDERLGALPYLDDGYGFIPRSTDHEHAWVNRVFAFNFSSAVSHGPHSTSISGHKHAVPRLTRGVTRRLMVDVEANLMADLEAYRSEDLPVPDDFEQTLTNRPSVDPQSLLIKDLPS